MSKRTIWVCDQCGKEVEAYEPAGWLKAFYNVRSLRGLESTDIKADLCSQECERLWLLEHITNVEREQ